jgi:hypothetical protein
MRFGFRAVQNNAEAAAAGAVPRATVATEVTSALDANATPGANLAPDDDPDVTLKNSPAPTTPDSDDDNSDSDGDETFRMVPSVPSSGNRLLPAEVSAAAGATAVASGSNSVTASVAVAVAPAVAPAAAAAVAAVAARDSSGTNDSNPPQVQQLSPATTIADTTVTAAAAAGGSAMPADRYADIIASYMPPSRSSREQPVLKLRFTEASLQVIAERQKDFEVKKGEEEVE